MPSKYDMKKPRCWIARANTKPVSAQICLHTILTFQIFEVITVNV